jgi:hypothetical protein
MTEVVKVSSIVATTDPVAKYPGLTLHRNVMQQLATALKNGQLPLLSNHDVTKPVTGRVLDAQVVELANGATGVEATFEVDAVEWAIR